MIFNIHAGHNPDGKIASGAVGLIKESTEDRRVKERVIYILKNVGHTVYDCTVENATDSLDVLKKITDKCNKHTVNLDISIHFNDSDNPEANGTEVHVYSKDSKAYTYAQKIVDNISRLGFKNRGVKISPQFFVLKKTKSPALLIETCFVKNTKDVELYKKNIDKIAEAIVSAITNNKEVNKTVDINLDILKTGSKGNQVETLQAMLNIKNSAFLSVDGEFGNKTDAAVRKFQTKKKLTVDGCVGKETWTELLKNKWVHV